jgi:hypothetical protein
MWAVSSLCSHHPSRTDVIRVKSLQLQQRVLQTCNVTLSYLIDKAKSLSGLEEFYSENWMKTKLSQRYGDRIFFVEINGHRNVLCW